MNENDWLSKVLMITAALILGIILTLRWWV
jgi:hypothetical protein